MEGHPRRPAEPEGRLPPVECRRYCAPARALGPGRVAAGGTGQRLQVTRCSRDAVGPSDPCYSAGTCSHHKASPESLPARQEYHPLTTLFRCCVHFFLTKVFLKNHKEPRVLSGQVDKASQSLHVGSRTRCPGSSAVSSVTGPPPRVTGVLTPVIPPQVSPACAGPCVVSRARGNAPRPGVTCVTHLPLC